ncbi:MAG TPA: DUF2752 domain-containing protein [Candidatus Acidoferrales bacterium]|jgi:hypothetical protein|nr:DUF2752 domain-containing protein [Candidatus Acidoferrales bacterium]
MTPAPPKISPANSASSGSSSFRLAAIILAIIAAGLAALVFFFNPATHGFYPVCQFHRLTGLNCPGCGMTRALYALLHGDLPAAFRDNALLVLAIPAVLARALWLAVQKSRGRPVANFLPGKYFWALLFIALAFTILRNLPAFAFLSPA